ncbi:hypothetical protein FNV43_RR23962 [Rhamnella rubrinervis]|uniref:Uncharacterized protein n=1 Tax=Rhamnella rubrinervis TaxID=2594499 RepID=A0A8K0DKV4_9ROSA|nr:hypothetical protein FNV43_RR23962 [Rhamnella rubrinervis]
MTSGNSLKWAIHDQNDEEDIDACGRNVPLSSTLKENGILSVIGETESDDDNIDPICELKRRLQEDKILLDTDSEDDESTKVSSDSEGESLHGFIVSSSDVSEDDGACSESECVKNLIKGCTWMYMPGNEVVDTLVKVVKIERHFAECGNPAIQQPPIPIPSADHSNFPGMSDSASKSQSESIQESPQLCLDGEPKTSTGVLTPDPTSNRSNLPGLATDTEVESLRSSQFPDGSSLKSDEDGSSLKSDEVDDLARRRRERKRERNRIWKKEREDEKKREAEKAEKAAKYHRWLLRKTYPDWMLRKMYPKNPDYNHQD